MLLRRTYNVLALLPFLVLVLFYLYWGLGRLFPADQRTLYAYKPDSIGLCTFLLLLYDVAVLVMCALMGQIRNLSRWSICLVAGTIIAVVLLSRYDRGGYLFWFFD